MCSFKHPMMCVQRSFRGQDLIFEWDYQLRYKVFVHADGPVEPLDEMQTTNISEHS